MTPALGRPDTRLRKSESLEGLCLDAPSKADLENVLAVSTTMSSMLSLTNLMKTHAKYTQDYMSQNLPCPCWVFMGNFEESLPSLHRDTAGWP